MVSKNLLRGVLVGGVITALLLLAAIWWLFLNVDYIVYETDTVIEGDLVVSKDQPIILRNNAKLTVKGDAFLGGEIRCENGAINLEVEGSLLASDEINCAADPEEVNTNEAGVRLVVKGDAFFTANSQVNSAGSFQLVDDSSKLAVSQTEIDQAFARVEAVESAGIQIGPISNEEAASEFEAPARKVSVLPFVQVAQAQEQLPLDRELSDLLGLGLPQEFEELINLMLKSPLSEQERREILDRFEKEIGDRFFPGLDEIFENNPNRQARREVERQRNEIKQMAANLLGAFGPEDFEDVRWLLERMIVEDQLQGPTVIPSGTLTIGKGEKPPQDLDVDEIVDQDKLKRKPKKIILNFDFSDGSGVALKNMTITGPDGITAASGKSGQCAVVGENGGDAMRFNVRAGNFRINNFNLFMGHGGDGSSVSSPSDCKEANVTGGNGGKPGNFRMFASNKFEIAGTFEIFPGGGGFGGYSSATTRDEAPGCSGEIAGNAVSKGGNGGDSMQKLRVNGTVSGSGNVKIGPATGGAGGTAISKAGTGSDGETCGCAGTKGGDATSTGGNGGNAIASAGGTSQGGDGGNAFATAGDGGFGGSCGIDEGPGGDGGGGGNATANAGIPGTGDIIGQTGQTEPFGGDAGNGGDGCGEGIKGSPPGTPDGAPGVDGKNTCTVPEKDKTQITAGIDPNSPYEIEVIQYGGSYLPIFQIRLTGEGEPACAQRHWHGGPAKLMTGVEVNDPNPGACGYGTIVERPIMKISVDVDQAVAVFGQGVMAHFTEKAQSPKAEAPQSSPGIQIRGGIFGN